MYDHIISTVVVGRSLATVAEISFAILVSICIVRITKENWMANFWVFINLVAQSCCWYSIITQNQLGHVIEESIWTFTSITMLIVCLKEYFSKKNTISQKKFLKITIMTNVKKNFIFIFNFFTFFLKIRLFISFSWCL